MNDYYAKDFIQQGHCYLFFKFNSPRRHEVHEEKPKKNLRVLRVFVVKCPKLMSMGSRFLDTTIVLAIIVMTMSGDCAIILQVLEES